jgi:hypothetical protein
VVVLHERRGTLDGRIHDYRSSVNFFIQTVVALCQGACFTKVYELLSLGHVIPVSALFFLLHALVKRGPVDDLEVWPCTILVNVRWEQLREEYIQESRWLKAERRDGYQMP